MSCQAEIKPLDTTVNSEVREDLTGPKIGRNYQTPLSRRAKSHNFFKYGLMYCIDSQQEETEMTDTTDTLNLGP